MNKLLVSVIIMLSFFSLALQGNEDHQHFFLKFSSMKEFQQWLGSQNIKFKYMMPASFIPEGSSENGVYTFESKSEYICYVFKDKDNFDKFDDRYKEFYQKLGTSGMNWASDKVKLYTEKVEFRIYYNVKCASNPAYLPL
jgi:hypothetical protein